MLNGNHARSYLICTIFNVAYRRGNPLQERDGGRFEYFLDHMLELGHRLPCQPGDAADGGLRERFALLLEHTACGTHLRFGRLVAHVMRARRGQALAFHQRKAIVELHDASMAAARSGIAVPCPSRYGFDGGLERRLREVLGEAEFLEVVLVVRVCLQQAGEPRERSMLSLAIDDRVRIVPQLLEQDAVARVAGLFELWPLVPWAGHVQLYVVGQLAELVDVVVQFVREPPGMTGSFGHRPGMEVRIGIKPRGKGGIDCLHIRDRLGARMGRRADRRDGIVKVAMAAGAIANDQVRCGKACVFPDHRMPVVEIEDQPAHHAWAVDLHVGIADRVLARPDPGRGLVVAAARQIRRFHQHAMQRGAWLEKARERRRVLLLCCLCHIPLIARSMGMCVRLRARAKTRKINLSLL